MKRTLRIIGIVLVALFVTGCAEGGPRVILDPDYEMDDFAPTQESNYTPEPTKPKPTPTQPPFMISKDVFTFPTSAMAFNPPVFWNLDKQTANYVKYISDDRRAFLEAGYESTGYELEREAFEAYKDNAIQSLYRASEEYKISDEYYEDSTWFISSSLVNNGLTWNIKDIFVQRSHAIFYFSFHALADDWPQYETGFDEIFEGMETKSGYVTLDFLYEFTNGYSEPGNVFSVWKPIGWGISDLESIDERTIRQSLISPDGFASMQTVKYTPEEELTPNNIGQTAIDLLRELIADDLKITDDYVLADSRIRLNWVSSDTDSSGFTFFWLSGYDLYLLTFMQGEEQESVNLQVLYQIGDSFKFQTTGSGS